MSVRRSILGAREIERRPRGASRASSLLHLFRASYACDRRARPPCLYDAISRYAPRRSRANPTGIIGPKQTERPDRRAGGQPQACGALHGRGNTAAGAVSVRRSIFGAREIERRPRGASRASSLLHLFRASYACDRRARPPCLYDAITRYAPRSSRANPTGIIGPKQTERPDRRAGGQPQACGALHGRGNTAAGAVSVRRSIFGAREIERRPRGASRASSLLHLFRASYACDRRARPPCLYDAISRHAPRRSRANPTGIIGPKQM